jgi:hypothetical protein
MKPEVRRAQVCRVPECGREPDPKDHLGLCRKHHQEAVFFVWAIQAFGLVKPTPQHSQSRLWKPGEPV